MTRGHNRETPSLHPPVHRVAASTPGMLVLSLGDAGISREAAVATAVEGGSDTPTLLLPREAALVRIAARLPHDDAGRKSLKPCAIPAETGEERHFGSGICGVSGSPIRSTNRTVATMRTTTGLQHSELRQVWEQVPLGALGVRRTGRAGVHRGARAAPRRSRRSRRALRRGAALPDRLAPSAFAASPSRPGSDDPSTDLAPWRPPPVASARGRGGRRARTTAQRIAGPPRGHRCAGAFPRADPRPRGARRRPAVRRVGHPAGLRAGKATAHREALAPASGRAERARHGRAPPSSAGSTSSASTTRAARRPTPPERSVPPTTWSSSTRRSASTTAA